jgi:hypothetical protein
MDELWNFTNQGIKNIRFYDKQPQQNKK